MPAKKPIKPKTQDTKAAKKDELSIPVYSLTGEETSKMGLPAEVFAAKVNKALLAQATRVYLNNLTGHFSNTKTRGEVAGSTRKLFKQKGTGHARHGAIRAPIYVGGGIALGPKGRKIALELPLKMKRAALKTALADKMMSQEIFGLANLEEATGKTVQMYTLLKTLGKTSAIIVSDKKYDKAALAIRNLPKTAISLVDELNVLDLLKYKTLFLTKEAVEKLETKLVGKKAQES